MKRWKVMVIRMRMISCDFTVLLRRRYLNIACKPSCPTPQWKSSAPSSSTRPPFHFSQGGFLQFIQPIYHLLHHCQTCLQCCRSVQDNSGAPGQRPNKVADRENHLKLLSPPADAPGGTMMIKNHKLSLLKRQIYHWSEQCQDDWSLFSI